jgi:ABC-type proline/glycine betaine transport system substrate-binding protein
MKKLTIGVLILLTLVLSACHSDPKSETITIIDTTTISDSAVVTSVFDKMSDSSKVVDSLKK